MKRLTQKVKVKSNYIEDQEEHLCGKHAINNILLEQKFVWEEEKGLLIGGDDPLKKGTKINLWASCNLYEARLKVDELGPALDNKMNEIMGFLTGASRRRKEDFEGHFSFRSSNTRFAMSSDYVNRLTKYAKTQGVNLKTIGKKEQQKLSANMDYDYENGKWEEVKKRYEELYGGKSRSEIETKIKTEVMNEMFIHPDRLCVTKRLNDDDMMGQIPIQVFPEVLSLLGLKGVILDNPAAVLEAEAMGDKVDELVFDKAFKRRLNTEINKPSLLGVLLSSGTHWVCISKYSNLCKGQTGYALVDSVSRGIKRVCRKKAELLKELDDFDVLGAVFIYAHGENPYLAEAVKRMRNVTNMSRKKGGK